jgi:hypothetical protein
MQLLLVVAAAAAAAAKLVVPLVIVLLVVALELLIQMDVAAMAALVEAVTLEVTTSHHQKVQAVLMVVMAKMAKLEQMQLMVILENIITVVLDVKIMMDVEKMELFVEIQGHSVKAVASYLPVAVLEATMNIVV